MSDSSYEVKVSFAIRLVNRSHISLIMYHVIYMISDTLACSPTFCASARLIKDQTWRWVAFFTPKYIFEL